MKTTTVEELLEIISGLRKRIEALESRPAQVIHQFQPLLQQQPFQYLNGPTCNPLPPILNPTVWCGTPVHFGQAMQNQCESYSRKNIQ